LNHALRFQRTVEMSGAAVANGYAIGAALLGFWLFRRYPRLGAQTFKGAFLTTLCAYCLLLGVGPATGAADAAAGPLVALLAVVLPSLTFSFWAGFRLLAVTLETVRQSHL
jgi:hypothetical protein